MALLFLKNGSIPDLSDFPDGLVPLGSFPLESPFPSPFRVPSRFIARGTGPPPCFRSLLVSVPLPLGFPLGFPLAAAPWGGLSSLRALKMLSPIFCSTCRRTVCFS